jgi:hypothetical protein
MRYIDTPDCRQRLLAQAMSAHLVDSLREEQDDTDDAELRVASGT